MSKIEIKFDGNRRWNDKKQYGIYHPAEVGPCVSGFDPETGTVEKEGIEVKREYIAWFENNAPSMNEKLWRIREQMTIATKSIFDAILELPPMEKREAVRKVSEYTGISKETVRYHFGSIMWAIEEMDELDNLKKAA
jgi:hypothetical protein